MINLKKIDEKIKRFSFRERILITIFLCVIVFAFWQIIVFDKQDESKISAGKNRENISKEIADLKKEHDFLMKSSDKKNIGDLSSRIERLKKLNRVLEAEIIGLTRKLIEPRKMLNLLQDILSKDDSIKVITLKNLEERSLFDTDDNGNRSEKIAESESGIKIYKHGIEIELEGTFFGVMEFLYELEKLDWHFMWDSLKYDVKIYPTANVKLVLYTLSLDDSWIEI